MWRHYWECWWFTHICWPFCFASSIDIGAYWALQSLFAEFWSFHPSFNFLSGVHRFAAIISLLMHWGLETPELSFVDIWQLISCFDTAFSFFALCFLEAVSAYRGKSSFSNLRDPAPFSAGDKDYSFAKFFDRTWHHHPP